jgi:hypothetical protein
MSIITTLTTLHSLQVIQKLPYGQSADMWAVGTVLYRCISGAHPFVPNESCLHKQLNFKGE